MSQVIINKAGPLPISVTIPWPSSETVLVSLSGSVWSKAPDTMVGVQLNIKDSTVGIAQIYANEASTHMALPTGFFAVDGGYGNITVTLAPLNAATVSDQNDIFTVSLIF